MSNVVYDKHDANSLGDVSHALKDLEPANWGKNKGNEDLINNHDYHFHSTIQIIEDGLQEQWKEQNKNINQNRENPVSSMTDAKFRKLYTTMVFPYVYNLLTVIFLFMFVPLLFSINIESDVFNYMGIAVATGMFASVIFDAYVIYRSKKYVIEKVTNRYHKILRKTWRSFEYSAIFIVCVLYSQLYTFFYTDAYNIEFTNRILKRIISYINFENYLYSFIMLTLSCIALYSLLAYRFIRVAKKEQRKSVIEARSASEHNADVAQSIMSGKIDDFED